MDNHPNTTGASIIPTVRYRDVPAAVTWLQEAFGFAPHRLVKDAKGAVLYAELTFGTGMVMVAPIQESPLGKLMVQPDEIGGVETQICYLYIANTRAHYARAKAAGAEILLDIEAETRNGRGYSCRDLEGHVWNFGTHNPWHLKGPAAGGRRRSHRTGKALAACLLLLAASGGLYIHQPAREAATNLALTILDKVSASIESAKAEQTPHGATDDSPLREMRELLSRERLARVAADRHVGDIREQLMRERRAREAAELAVKTAGESRVESSSLPSAPSPAAKAAETAAAEARVDLAKARGALQAAAEQLAQAQKAKEAAERGAKEAREQFAQLRSARDAAETLAREAQELAVRERNARVAAQRTLRQMKTSPYTPFPLD
jgi:uncharacterized glyoxalase superfamily protein PhnB